jgi:transcriptional regulator with XRE-family HTH domain
MQKQGGRETPTNIGVSHNFGAQMKAARAKAAMTQAALQARLQDGFGIKLDTSGITRTEAGSREPRLSEVLAISVILGLELNDFTPAQDLNRLVSDLTQQLLESRKTLLDVLESVDQIADYATKNPASLGDDTLANVLNRHLDGFKKTLERRPASNSGKAKETDTANGKLKGQVVSAVTASLGIT